MNQNMSRNRLLATSELSRGPVGRGRSGYAALVAALPLFLPAAARAQSAVPATPSATAPTTAPTIPDPIADTGGIEDVIVTAQRTSESAQSIPLAITAVSAGKLEALNVTDLLGLQALAPGFYIANSGGTAILSIRGISSQGGLGTASALGSAQTVAIYTDGVYLSDSVAALRSFPDLERVEVLLGPQAVLYGRNATGGAINIISKRPDVDAGFDGEIDAQRTDYDGHRVRFALGAPIVSGALAIRLSGVTSRRDGYTKNLYVGSSQPLPGATIKTSAGRHNTIDPLYEDAVRGSILWAVSPAVDVVLRGNYQKETRGFSFQPLEIDQNDVFAGPMSLFQTQSPFPAQKITPSSFANCTDPRTGAATYFIEGEPFLTCSFTANSTTRKYYFASGEVNADLGFANLTSISGYTRINAGDIFNNNTGSAVPFIATVGDSGGHLVAKSQEVYLSSKGTSFDWLVGGSYYDESVKDSLRKRIQFGRIQNGVPGQEPRNKTRSYAFYGEVTYRFVDDFAVRLGGRYTNEKIDNLSYTAAGAPQPVAVRDKDFSPKAVLEYSPDFLDGLFYAKVEKGFKSGGVNPSNLIPFNAENLWDYEIGFKSQWLDRTLRVNGAAFYYDYSNLQVSTAGINPVTNQPQNFVQNAASAVTKGASLEVAWRPTRALTFSGNYSFLDAKIGDGVCLLNPNASANAAGDPTRAWRYRDNNFNSFICLDAAGKRRALTVGAGYFGSVVDVSGNRLPRAPRHQLSLSSTYDLDIGSLGKLTFNGVGTYTSAVEHTVYETFVGVFGSGVYWPQRARQSGYTIFNASVAWRSKDDMFGLSVFANNLTDKVVQSNISTPVQAGPVATYLPPRVVGVEGRVRF